jgi:hypothetical protein
MERTSLDYYREKDGTELHSVFAHLPVEEAKKLRAHLDQKKKDTDYYCIKSRKNERLLKEAEDECGKEIRLREKAESERDSARKERDSARKDCGEWKAQCSEYKGQAEATNAKYESLQWAITTRQLLEGPRDYVATRLLQGLDDHLINQFMAENNHKTPKTIPLLDLVTLAQENPSMVDKNKVGPLVFKFCHVFALGCEEVYVRGNKSAHPHDLLLDHDDYREKALKHLFTTEVFRGMPETQDLLNFMDDLSWYSKRKLKDRKWQADERDRKRKRD